MSTRTPVLFELKKYLRDYISATKRGTCIKCDQPVWWSFERLRVHKKLKCPDEEFTKNLKIFLKKQHNQLASDEGKRDCGRI